MLYPFGSDDEFFPGYRKVRVRRKEDFIFANVDLELEGPVDLQPLLDELQEHVGALYHQGYDNQRDMANLEVRDWPGGGTWIYNTFDDRTQMVGGPDILILAFCEMLETLSPAARQIWKQCTRREFDVGFTCGNTLKSYKTRIQASTLQRCAALGASVMLTVYPHVNHEWRKQEDEQKSK